MTVSADDSFRIAALMRRVGDNDDTPAVITAMGDPRGFPSRCCCLHLRPDEYDAFFAELCLRLDGCNDAPSLNERSFGASLLCFDFDLPPATSEDVRRLRRESFKRLGESFSYAIRCHCGGVESDSVVVLESGESRFHLLVAGAVVVYPSRSAWALKEIVEREHMPTEDLQWFEFYDKQPIAQRHKRVFRTRNSKGGGLYAIAGVCGQTLASPARISITPSEKQWAALLRGRYFVVRSLASRRDEDVRVCKWDLPLLEQIFFPRAIERYSVDSDDSYDSHDSFYEQPERERLRYVFVTPDMAVLAKKADADEPCRCCHAICGGEMFMAVIVCCDYYRVLTHSSACGLWHCELIKRQQNEID